MRLTYEFYPVYPDSDSDLPKAKVTLECFCSFETAQEALQKLRKVAKDAGDGGEVGINNPPPDIHFED